ERPQERAVVAADVDRQAVWLWLIASDEFVRNLLEMLDDTTCLAGVIRVVLPQELGVDDIEDLHMAAILAHVQVDRIELRLLVELVGRHVFLGEGYGCEVHHYFNMGAIAQPAGAAMKRSGLHGVRLLRAGCREFAWTKR